MNKKITIAIDGPVGSGKGTLAMALVRKLNALYIYTGAMYRELALACLRENTDINDEEKVLEVLRGIKIELKLAEDGIKAFLNGKDVSTEISQPAVSRAVPVVAALPKVREKMVNMQKKLVENARGEKNIIIEGRDISTNVMPNADLKVFLTADIKTRGKRRFDQFREKGIDTTFDEVIKDVERRDRMDIERKASPLTITKDAIVIDTTNDTVEDTLNKVIGELKERRLI